MKEDNKEFEIEQLNDDEINAYLEVMDEETPDLWDRISKGFDSEIAGDKKDTKIVDLQAEKKRRKKILSGYLVAAAAVLFIVLVAVKGSLDVKDRTNSDYINDSFTESENTSYENIGLGDAADPAESFENTSLSSVTEMGATEGCITEEFIPGNPDGNGSNNVDSDNLVADKEPGKNETDNSVSNDNSDVQTSPDTDFDAANDKATENVEIVDDVNVIDSAKPSMVDDAFIDAAAVSEVTFKKEAEKATLSKKKSKRFIKLFNTLRLNKKDETDTAFEITYTIHYDDGKVCEISLCKDGIVLVDGVYYEGDKKVINELIEMANIK